jgi:hypothetical protein
VAGPRHVIIVHLKVHDNSIHLPFWIHWTGNAETGEEFSFLGLSVSTPLDEYAWQ